MTAREFETRMLKAEVYYKDGKYYDAIQMCNFAFVYTKSDEERALVLNRRGYAERFYGFKSKVNEHKQESYEMARKDWRKVLELSSNIDLRISVIRGLMLLPGEDIEALCQTGKVAISNYADNLEAELINSYGLVVRETDQERAISIFTDGYDKAERGTIISGHLAQNVGTCRLIQKNQEESLKSKKEYAISAIISLKVALEEYPEDQKEHRRAVENKIANTRAEIENNFQ